LTVGERRTVGFGLEPRSGVVDDERAAGSGNLEYEDDFRRSGVLVRH
jgi:hypothetical protein